MTLKGKNTFYKIIYTLVIEDHIQQTALISR